VFSSSYFQSYVSSAWATYQNTPLTVVPFQNEPNRKFTGRTSGGVLNFTNTAGQQVASFQQPSTRDVFNCDGRLAAPNNDVGAISRSLCAALNRSTLGYIHTQPTYNASQFYTRSITNHYSKIVHANMVDGKAYGFAFDDVGAFESLVHDGDPRSAGIILSPFGAGGGNPPPPTGGAVSILSNWNNKCIDVPNWNFNDRQRVHMWDCTDGTNQKWQWVDGTLRTENNKCLDVADAATHDGAAVQIYTCNGTAAQQFVLSAAGDLVNPQADKCVDIAEWKPDNGALIHLWTCVGGANQKWRRG